VTAFADAFNAIDQKILINGSKYEDVVASPAELEEMKLNDLDVSLKQNLSNWLTIWQTAFRSSIGDFKEDNQLQYYSYADWLIFFLAILFLIILMLNLLISVIAQAQADYFRARVQLTYREKALQIRRIGNSFLWLFYRAE